MELESSVVSLELISRLRKSFVLVLLISLKTLTDAVYRMTSADTKRDKCFKNQPKYTELSLLHKYRKPDMFIIFFPTGFIFTIVQ